jgi:hypothetical protein
MFRHYKSYRTNVFFHRLNLRVGAGSIFNISGNYYKFRYLQNGASADSKALENDWGVVAQDITKAMKAFHANKL